MKNNIKSNIDILTVNKSTNFIYQVEDNITDVSMFINLLTIKANENKVELKELISTFCRGNDNDQYKIFERAFLHLFKSDGAKSFNDYKSVYKRALDIKKNSKMIHDVRVNVELFYFKEIDKYNYRIDGTDYLLKESDLNGFFKDNYKSLITNNSDLEKSPKYYSMGEIEVTSELYEKEVSVLLDTSLNKIDIYGEEFDDKKIVDRALKEISKNSRKNFEKLFPENIENVKVVKKIIDEYEVFNNIDLPKKYLSTFGDNINFEKNNNTISYDGDNFLVIEYYEYKNVILIKQNTIEFNEFLKEAESINDSYYTRNIIDRIVNELNKDNSKKYLEMVENHIAHEALDEELEKLLLTKISALIDYKRPLLSKIFANKLLTNNSISSNTSYKDRYLLIKKHYPELLSKEDENILLFLYNASLEDRSIVDKHEEILIIEFENDKEKIISEIKNFINEGSQKRGTINGLYEEHPEIFATNKELNERRAIAKEYLNKYHHLGEERNFTASVWKKNPELKEVELLFQSKYKIELVNNNLIAKLKEKDDLFKKLIQDMEEFLKSELEKIKLEELNS